MDSYRLKDSGGRHISAEKHLRQILQILISTQPIEADYFNAYVILQ